MKPEIHSASEAWQTDPSIGADATRHRGSPSGSAGADRRVPRPLATKSLRICVTRRLHAPAKVVFHAWLDPGIAGRWLFATASRPMARADIDARVAGAFRFVERRDGALIEHRGEYTEIVQHRRIAFTLLSEDIPDVVTRATVDIAPTQHDRCSVTLIHRDVPSGVVTRTRQRWIGILYGLDATLDAQGFS